MPRYWMTMMYKSETMNRVYAGLKDASLGQLRDMHREARYRFDTANTEDDAIAAALFMHQIRFVVWKRFKKDDPPVTAKAIRLMEAEDRDS
jgi:hypothetical protein